MRKIMKKLYQTPESLTVALNIQRPLLQATSNMGIDTGSEVPGDIPEDDKLVKGHNVWDDDDDWD